VITMHKIVLFLIFACSNAIIGFGQILLHPEIVSQCLKNKKTSGLKVFTEKNPYYLRGDFDGDRKPDYALEVELKSKGTGVLICAGNGSIYLLGAGIGGMKFSDLPDDSFLATYWKVYTEQDITELAAWTHNVPHPVPSIKGREAIAMIWEDGISLIYWDGIKFRWAGSSE
jgi:hypothetical protein